ncbi:longevity assurance proteins LAG1/LAC1 [Mycena alexandri]|uniref:Longevity assurance proteins LAG1/LAC1 n=1 Tax=Mycena alexandri TaxID=1745969 RepID=A0AAD6S2L4_9AGAR|nr:longevity assurance proteins LAG1/LAC1 [Mycena alexandri]
MRTVSPWLRWVVDPVAAFKLLLVPVFLYFIWELLTPRLDFLGLSNPFGILFLISSKVPTSDPADPRYAKSWSDLLFIAYYVLFSACFRQTVVVSLCRPVAKYFGIKKEAKLVRFGEQGYSVIYFALFGGWGYRVMSQLPTWWYRTEYFWLDYPHWDMKPELKRYYLMQTAHWTHEFLILVLRLERPRSDYYEFIAHHIVTLWLVGWGYMLNLTLIGNAVFLSMDIPDAFFAFSKVMNYLQFKFAKVVSLAIFTCVWTYFRHYLSLVILWSVATEFDLIPAHAQRWDPADGTYLVWWMKYQIFVPLALLQWLNIFWYYLIWRVIARAVMTSLTDADDDRSDDEGEGGD